MNIGEYLQRRSRGKYSPIFTEPEENNCFNVIFSVNIKKVQNNGLKQDKKAGKGLDWFSSRASKMLYSPGSAVKITLNSYIHI